MGESSIGQLIKKRRESLGLSQARLGELVGRSASTIRNWERDRTSPSERSDVVALAAILGLDERNALSQAGFDASRQPDHPTLEQAFASIGPHPEEIMPVEGDEPGEEPAETEAVVGEAVSTSPPEDPEPSEAPAATRLERQSTRWTPAAPADEPVAAPDGEEKDAMEPEPGLTAPDRIRRPASRADFDGDDKHATQRTVERAAPPTVLETAPTAEPSYLEDPEERQQYRMRALITAIAVVVLVIVLVWSFDRTTTALGNMWNQFVSMLDL